MTRRAACNCGQLQLTCEGEPVRISLCHCLACQRRTGAAFGYQAWFERPKITAISGRSTKFKRVADSGRSVTSRFCPVCGSTVYWEVKFFDDLYDADVATLSIIESASAALCARPHDKISRLGADVTRVVVLGRFLAMKLAQAAPLCAYEAQWLAQTLLNDLDKLTSTELGETE